VTLQHELGHASVWVPELNTTVLGPTEYPVTVGCKSNAQNEVLVALKGTNAFASRRSTWHQARGSRQLPHLDGLVETTADQPIARWSKGHRVDAVFVAMLALQAHYEVSGEDLPHANALVKGTSCDEAVVWGDGDRGDTVLDGQIENLLVGLQIPQSDAAITTARCDKATIASEVKRINVLLMASELVLDGAAGDVPDLLDVSMT
jgi:hypothetical protein